MRMRVPSTVRHSHTESGWQRALARIGVRRCSTSSVTIRHVSARSKPSGRSTGSPVGSTDVIRSTRNVRWPASVPATRYQTVPLVASPSGWTVRVVVERSRAT